MVGSRNLVSKALKESFLAYWGEELGKRRAQAGYTQESLATAMHISEQAVRDWEAGRSEPGPENYSHLESLGILPNPREGAWIWLTSEQKPQVDAFLSLPINLRSPILQLAAGVQLQQKVKQDKKLPQGGDLGLRGEQSIQ